MDNHPSLPIEERILFGIEQVVQAMSILYERQSRQGEISPLQLRILETLLNTRALNTVGGMAEELSLTPATVSDALSSLEKKGLLIKQRRPEDRRVVRLALSPEGKRLARTVTSSTEDIAEVIRTLSEEEKGVLLTILMRLIRGFQDKKLIPVARMCSNCRFFQPNVHPDPTLPHHCGFVDAAFGDQELRIECPDYELSSGFTGPRSRN